MEITHGETDIDAFVTSVTASSPLFSSGGFTPNLTIQVATTAQNGYLSSTDWNTFNNKEVTLTFSTGLTRSANTVTANISTGVSGGQTILGGTAANDDLTIRGTSHATKTTSYVLLQDTGGSVVIGTSSPTVTAPLVLVEAAAPVLRLWNTGGGNNRKGFQLREESNVLNIDSLFDTGAVFKTSTVDIDQNWSIAGLTVTGTTFTLSGGANVFTSGKIGFNANAYVQFNTGSSQVFATTGTDPIKIQSGAVILATIKKANPNWLLQNDAATSVIMNMKGTAAQSTDYFEVSSSAGTGDILAISSAGNIGIGQTAPTALLHLKAGTATASTAPIKLTSGTLLTTAEVGAHEFLTDDFYLTITTGAARKGIVLNDGSNLTSGRIPFATTNGRLIDDADLTFATDTLTATKIVGTTSIKVGSVAGYISSDGSTGATGSFTTADLKTVTVKDGIITSIV